MGYLISPNKALLEVFQLKVHNYMKANISGYNADRWAEVIKHQSQELYAILIKESDPRLPFNAITNNEKLSLIDNLPDGWSSDPNPIGVKTIL